MYKNVATIVQRTFFPNHLRGNCQHDAPSVLVFWYVIPTRTIIQPSKSRNSY